MLEKCERRRGSTFFLYVRPSVGARALPAPLFFLRENMRFAGKNEHFVAVNIVNLLAAEIQTSCDTSLGAAAASCIAVEGFICTKKKEQRNVSLRWSKKVNGRTQLKGLLHNVRNYDRYYSRRISFFFCSDASLVR